MTPIQHYKTFHIYPDESIQTFMLQPAKHHCAVPGNSYHVRLCYHSHHNTCAQMDLLARAFTDAQLYHDDCGVEEPFHISIFVPPMSLKKFKPTDEDAIIDRIEWIIKNFQPPSIPLIISIYVAEKMTTIESGFFTSTVWPLRRRWKAENTKRVVTCQQVEGRAIGAKGNEWKLKHVDELIDLTENLAGNYNYDINFIDYTMSYENVLCRLLESKMHFGYIGASYFIASAAGVPTLGFGRKAEKLVHNGISYPKNLFSTAQSGFFHTRQRNLETLKVDHMPVTTASNTILGRHVLEEFYRLEGISYEK